MIGLCRMEEGPTMSSRNHEDRSYLTHFIPTSYYHGILRMTACYRLSPMDPFP